MNRSILADQISMKLKSIEVKNYGVPFRHRTYARGPGESLESKNIRKLGNQLKTIERQTQYIKENGVAPPSTPNYYLKKLNSF